MQFKRIPGLIFLKFMKQNNQSKYNLTELEAVNPANIFEYSSMAGGYQRKSLFTKIQQALVFTFSTLWITFVIMFALWWSQEVPMNSIQNLIISIPVFWMIGLWVYLIGFSLRQTKTISLEIPDGKVALITTKTPGEPWELVKNTLKKMISQDFPARFDVWLADESPSEETIDWCQNHSVRISSRKGNLNYFNSTYPRKARTKEGNLAYFYDNWGYRDYDFVLQFDSDHAPERTYLLEIMKEFNNPSVGFVAAPSITDANFDSSWTVRARCNWESTTHGILQSGSYGNLAPTCFGSHYAIRTKALEDIGGIGPELAEDFTTSMMMLSSGWKGGFARNAIARGFGAVGLAESLYQEYQWVVSMVHVLFEISPKYLGKVGILTFAKLMVILLWYPLVSLVTLISLIYPIYAVLSNDQTVNVPIFEFTIYYSIINIIPIFYILYLRNLEHLRPVKSFQITPGTIIFQVLQFPWIFIGLFRGLFEVITKANPKKLKVTDKDNNSIRPLSFVWLFPHIIISITNIAVLYYSIGKTFTNGFIYFVVYNAIIYSLAILFAVCFTLKENFDILDNPSKLNYILKYKWTILSTITTILLMILTIIKFQGYF
ncbi:MAG: glycosyltransferase family 2 protein [Patescibacteria group bacterium]